MVDGDAVTLDDPLEHEAVFTVNDAKAVLLSEIENKPLPYLTKSADGQFYIINSHTFSEADFKAVGEVLLAPRPLGIINLPLSWANTIRGIFNKELPIQMDAPTRVTYQPLANGEIVLHNYNKESVEVQLAGIKFNSASDVFSGEQLTIEGNTMKIKLNARSRIWVRPY